jgi:hypothetical protein
METRMARKTPSRSRVNKPADPSIAGEEDPGAALDTGDPAAPGTPASGEAVCHRCSGSGRFNDASCPTCGGTGKVTRSGG